MKRLAFAILTLCLTANVFAQSIGSAELKRIQGSFVKDSATVALQNIISHTGDLASLAARPSNCADIDDYFKYRVTPLKSGTDQHTSGRCWLFSSLNYIRHLAIDKYNVDDFRFAPVFDSFWDLFEKCNHFLEITISDIDDDINCRQLAHYYRTGLRDGGEWHNFINLALKYGVVPESVMKETVHSDNTANLREIINRKLRVESWNMREMRKKGAGVPELREYKLKVMEDIYRLLALSFGEPPAEFTWNYTDRDGKRHSLTTTPQEFFKSIVSDEFMASRVMIMNDPTHEYYKMYTIEDYSNSVEGEQYTYLNLPAEDIKPGMLASIKDNEPVYFTCDWSKERLLPQNIMAPGNYDYESLFGMSFEMDKKARVLTRYSTMAHVMIITACDTDGNDRPTKWQLYNSSHSSGAGVYLTFTDDWFDEYGFRIMFDRKYLNEKALEALKLEPEKYPISRYEFMH